MDFKTLWENVSGFRALFKYHGITSAEGARRFWRGRYPHLTWRSCDVDGCQRLVVEGERCTRHLRVSKKMPIWQWNQGQLYRLLRFRHGAQGSFPGEEYRPYLWHVCEREYGPLEPGYQPHRINGNPVDYRPQNIVPLSHPMKLVVDAERLSIYEALEADVLIGGIIGRRNHRPRAAAIIGHRDIGRAVGLTPSGVRSAIARGALDLNKPETVVAFLAKRLLEKQRTSQ